MQMNAGSVRPIAFYLPQYHPIPENDAWWGKGFTEWRNVAQAQPRFPDHYQPHLPADLGFYDLRLPEVREAQADLAREYGIHGFCYYHYWFNGKRLLERPLDEMLASGQPDFPFCLCWANENWTRAWDGGESEILIGEDYSEDDDRQHIQWLARVFADKRYIRIDDKPVLLVYRATNLPSPSRTTAIWRGEARRLGIGELYLGRVESIKPYEDGDPTKLGFDAAIEFQPDWSWFGTPLPGYSLGLSANASERENHVYDYATVVSRMLSRPQPTYKRFPCVSPTWDNTARRRKGDAWVLHNSTPEFYGVWLGAVLDTFRPGSPSENLVFINAWNEWAEGCHLEPCQKWGRGYLEATRDALTGAKPADLKLVTEPPSTPGTSVAQAEADVVPTAVPPSIAELEQKIRSCEAKLAQQQGWLAKQNEKVAWQREKLTQLQARLNRVDSNPAIRLYRAAKGCFGKSP